MSVFPAAITLADYDFDLLRLLKQPGYESQGPNVYAHSPVTLITAVMVKLTAGTGLLLPAAHLLHFTVTALTLVATYRYGIPLLGETLSLLCTLALFAFPVFFAQAGYMYLEMPLALAVVMALLAWRNDKLYQTAVWAVVAVWIKTTGIIVAGALFLAALAAPLSPKTKAYRILIVALVPAAVAVSQLTLWKEHAVDAAASSTAFSLRAYGCVTPDLSRYLARVPDLAAFLLLFFVISGVIYAKTIWQGLRSPEDSPALLQARTLGLSALVVICLLGLLYVVYPAATGGCNGLPRYYVAVLPLVFTTLSYALLRVGGRTLTAFVLTLFIAGFWFNREGTLYPNDVNTDAPGNNFALVERSYAYRQLSAVEREAMRFLEKRIPPQTPILFGLHEGYLNAYPLMGYVSRSMENARDVALFRKPDIDRFLVAPPDCVYFLYNYPWLGGQTLLYIMGKLRPTHALETVRIFQRDKYRILLIRARRKGSACQ